PLEASSFTAGLVISTMIYLLRSVFATTSILNCPSLPDIIKTKLAIKSRCWCHKIASFDSEIRAREQILVLSV
ncbi:hypothetical protein L9F63_025842, partial [Diploptera punctata]